MRTRKESEIYSLKKRMKYTLDELWKMYREFCEVAQKGNENSVGAFLAYIHYIQEYDKDYNFVVGSSKDK